MTTFSLYEKSSTYGGFYVMLMVNRLQILYFILLMPSYLVHPSMIWGILAVGIVSQLNLMIFSKWNSSHFPAKGYEGFVELLGERTVRIIAFVGLFLILLKLTVITLGYVQIVHKFMYPSMDKKWLILFVLLISCYVAAKGMEKTIRFVVITFFSTAWMIMIFIPFYFTPMASLHDLYPLIPTEWTKNSWKSLLFIWSSLAGPEYLVCLVPWLKPGQKTLKYLTVANAISVFEYLVVFIASLLFYGSNYLSISNIPVVHMLRYLQSPVLERVDLILISFNAFHFVFVIAIFLLFFFGAVRIIFGRMHEPTTFTGFILSCMTIFVCIVIVNEWLWEEATGRNIWLKLEGWSEALTYFLVPAFLLVSIKRKGNV